MTLDEAREVLGLAPDELLSKEPQEYLHIAELFKEIHESSPSEFLSKRFAKEQEEFSEAVRILQEEGERIRILRMEQMRAMVPGSVTGKIVDPAKKTGHVAASPEESARIPIRKIPLTVSEGAQSKRSGADHSLDAVLTLLPASVTGSNVSHKQENFFTESAKEDTAEATSSVLEETGKKEAVSAPTHSSSRAADKKRISGVFKLLLRVAIWLFFLLLLAVGIAAWLWNKAETARVNELNLLERLTAQMIEEKRWEEAENAYDQMERISPNSVVAEQGREILEAERKKEREAFVGSRLKVAHASLEKEQFQEALVQLGEILERYPDESEGRKLQHQIQREMRQKKQQQIENLLKNSIADYDWSAASEGMLTLRNLEDSESLIREYSRLIENAKKKEQNELHRADELASAARLRDAGAYDKQALHWASEAARLAPQNEEIRKLYEKLASYPRVIHVPGEIESLQQAIREARPHDQIKLEAGEYTAGILVDKAIHLEGAGEVVLRAEATEIPVMTFGSGSAEEGGSSIKNIVFHSQGFDTGTHRFPGVQVNGGKVEFDSCQFLKSSGNGLEVMGGGRVVVEDSIFSHNGWDGVSARGLGSELIVRKSRSEENVGHGFQVWNGATAQIRDCEAVDNVGNGILLDSTVKGIVVQGNVVQNNREYGILANTGISGKIEDNSCSQNLLGGLLVRRNAASISVQNNTLRNNQGGGLLLEQGLRSEEYKNNKSEKNAEADIQIGLHFHEENGAKLDQSSAAP